MATMTPEYHSEWFQKRNQDPEFRNRRIEQKRKWRQQNAERCRSYTKQYYAKNKKAQREKAKKWFKQNRDRHLKNRRAWAKQQRKSNPNFKLSANAHTRIWILLTRKQKTCSTLELIGCSIPELRAHLEKQFKPGMTWKNYGPAWHVDHIRPCAKFNLSDPSQQRECFHFSNLQPLFAKDNLQKGSR